MLWFLAVPYALASTVLVTYGLHLFVLGVRALRRPAPGDDAPAPAGWPLVTVQLPVYDEPDVVQRLIDAACALDYPRDRFDVQVLDDSPQGVAFSRAAERVAHWKRAGVAVEHVSRQSRDGFKAGALAHGLRRSCAEYLCVFDADFVPPGDFLRRTIPVLEHDRAAGLVQARWAHLNESCSALTRVQAALLDVHFVVEQGGRHAAGLMMSFNGTAGVWRRACIDDAGGWQTDTLTEDLDLSYRAQLAGWRLRYLPAVSAAGELPPTAVALRGQQSRWAKGTAETAIKLGGALVGADLPARLRAAGVLHLGSFLVHPALVLVALLHAPLRVLVPGVGLPGLAWAAAGITGGLALCGVAIAHAAAARTVGASVPARLALLPAILAVPAGLAVGNTVGILEAIAGRRTPFLRTPKAAAALSAGGGSWVAEAAFGLFAAMAAGVLVVHGYLLASAFQSIFAVGALWLAVHDLVDAESWFRPAGIRRASRGPRAGLHGTLPSVRRFG